MTPPSPDRYARQRILPEIGAQGQARLGRASVLIIGCGALGSVQAELIVRAGVGHVRLVDRDVIELHNLQRQVLYDEDDVTEGRAKADAAARKLARINSTVTLDARVTDCTSENIEALLEGVDLVLDGTDNFDTRYLINDACVKHGVPWIYGGVLGTYGMSLAILPGGPCFRCMQPEPPDAASLPTCDTAGVMNSVVNIVASLQVTAALRVLTGAPEDPPRIKAVDPWHGGWQQIDLSRSDQCPCCAERRFDFLSAARGSRHTVFCGRNAVQVSPERPTTQGQGELAARLASLGMVERKGQLLRFSHEDHRLLIFPDGRVLVEGTTDPALARTLVARFVGS